MDRNSYFKTMKLINKYDSWYFPLSILMGVLISIRILILIYMPVYILENIDDILQDFRYRNLRIIIIYFMILITATLMTSYIKHRLNIISENINLKLKYDIGKDSMEMEYYLVEDNDISVNRDRALFPIENQNIIPSIIQEISTIIGGVLQVFLTIAILINVNIILVLPTMVMMILNVFMARKAKKVEEKSMEEIIPLNRYFGYYMRVISDQRYGKDIRLYNIHNIIQDRLKDYHEKSSMVFSNMAKVQGRHKGILNTMVQLQIIIISIVMIWLNRYSEISIGSITAVLGATMSLALVMGKLIASILNYQLFSKYLQGYYDFRSSIQKAKRSRMKNKVGIRQIDTIKLDNISYRYKKSERLALENVNMYFEKGKTYSIVGMNGAGKSTFVKIISQLYNGYEGKIIINDTIVDDTVDYRDKLSCLFQDFNIFPISIMENIILDNHHMDKDIVYDYLKRLGLDKKVDKMNRGADTVIGTHLENDGINLSGGMSQKIAIIRAMVKNSDVLIMDEPTAAIDPLMEFEIYKVINQEDIGTDKIKIFISHRLASCTTSDYIYVMDQGKVIQQGEFDKLVNIEGKFKELWENQARFHNIKDID